MGACKACSSACCTEDQHGAFSQRLDTSQGSTWHGLELGRRRSLTHPVREKDPVSVSTSLPFRESEWGGDTPRRIPLHLFVHVKCALDVMSFAFGPKMMVTSLVIHRPSGNPPSSSCPPDPSHAAPNSDGTAGGRGTPKLFEALDTPKLDLPTSILSPPPQAIPWNLRLERRWKIDVLPLRLIALCVPAKWHVQDDSSTLHDHVDGKTSEEPLVLGLKHRTKIPGVQKGSQA